MTFKAADISPCQTYRYSLTRRWVADPHARVLTFVMLNPSTADADTDDPTIRRCIGFARREGFGRLRVVNLFAYRATNPKALLTCLDPVGPENDEYLDSARISTSVAPKILVAAWGVNAQPERVRRVLDVCYGADWRCLGTTKDGHPRHPLYVKGDQPLIPYALDSPAVTS